MTKAELKEYLEFYVEKYNNASFIPHDPISIPHQFTNPKDIESIGFIIATISWGNRLAILRNGQRLIDQMGGTPHDFILNASDREIQDLVFVHRTFNAQDLQFFIYALRNIYTSLGSLEKAFDAEGGMNERIAAFRNHFLATPHEKRSEKHVSNPLAGSASKRINMYLRWMVRDDKKGVDFGIWKSISPSELYIPLDVHTGNIARKLKLIKRKANDWKALEELMKNVRRFDAVDPCKYDFALFGIGVNNEI